MIPTLGIEERYKVLFKRFGDEIEDMKRVSNVHDSFETIYV